MIKTGQDALDYLSNRWRLEEVGRSSYWEQMLGKLEDNREDTVVRNTSLGNVSRAKGFLYETAVDLLNLPFFFVASDRVAFFKHYGIVKSLTDKQNRVVTHDILRQMLTLNHVQNYVDILDGDGCFLVIGDGYGMLTSLLSFAAPCKKVISVNLTIPLTFDITFATRADPTVGWALVTDETDLKAVLSDESVRLIFIQADNVDTLREAPIEFAANLHSMQEMDKPVIEKYFAVLRGNPATRTLFYCCNKLKKTLPNGEISTFHQYPWTERDSILQESLCPWSQWFWDSTPPFYHFRKNPDFFIWHRFADMEKTRW